MVSWTFPFRCLRMMSAPISCVSFSVPPFDLLSPPLSFALSFLPPSAAQALSPSSDGLGAAIPPLSAQ